MRLVILCILSIWTFNTGWGAEETTPLTDPRCLAHLTAWKENRQLIEGQSIAIRNGEVYLGKNRFTLFEASFHPELQTILYHHKDGRVPAEINYGAAQGVVPPKLHLAVIHGGGGMKSQGGSWLHFMNIMMSTKSKKGSTADVLKNLPTWVPTVAESIDLPGYGAGHSLDDFVSATAQINYLIKWFEDMKKASGGLPLVAIARSASTGLMPAIAHLRPDLLAGLILIGPMHPTVGLEENETLAYEHAHQTGEYRIGDAESRAQWIEQHLHSGVLRSPLANAETKADVKAIEATIDRAGGFPASGLRERLAWVTKLENMKLIEHQTDPIAFLDTLGALPGGTATQRRQWIEEKIRRDEFVPNLRGLEVLFGWYKDMGAANTGALNWHRHANPFNGVPTYVVWGESDWQVPDSVREAYRGHVQQAQAIQPLTDFGSWQDVGHDVVAVAHRSLPNEGKSTVIDVYSNVYKFLHAVSERQENLRSVETNAGVHSIAVP